MFYLYSSLSLTATYIRHPGVGNPLASSVYSAPPTYLKKGGDSTIGPGSRVLRMTDDLSGKRPLEKKRTQSEVAYGTVRPRSTRGTLPRKFVVLFLQINKYVFMRKYNGDCCLFPDPNKMFVHKDG